MPTEVSLGDGTRRSHFGIHIDANHPGSAGCPVIVNPPAFKDFCQRMKGFKNKGIDKIALQIDYPA
ncbi:hypothetical protein IQ266_17850 [filamentous cyanobacterium LEGE 11480]|uniref:Uncharacterized protein n=1 Tax=Romeriopsis navalis LEGE 11480 TaxID=2777977 RepID=A0A928VS81_9CYAN|nr:hypothetical protein [Romeriopsis navalis LEGE 11480]